MTTGSRADAHGGAATEPAVAGSAADVGRLPPRPVQARPALETGYVAPAPGIESRLARLWEAVLAVAPVGIDDDFFDLGGESLHAFALGARVQREFGVTLSPRDFFDCATVRAMAAAIVGRTTAR